MGIIGALYMEKQVMLVTVEIAQEGLKVKVYNALNVVVILKPS